MLRASPGCASSGAVRTPTRPTSRQPDEAGRRATIPPGARSTAPRRRASSTAARRWCARASSPSSAARSTSRRRASSYFNTTPLGRAVTTTAIMRAMREDGVDVFGDGSTHKGNDIQRFYRYGVLVNPAARDLQAVARPAPSSTALRRAQGDERVPRSASACRTRWRSRRRTRTDANVLGATHEAKDLERLDTGMRIVEPIMGVAFWKPRAWRSTPEEVTVDVRAQGVPGGAQRRAALRVPFELVHRRRTRSAAATASA